MENRLRVITITALILGLITFTTGCSSFGGINSNPEYEWLTGDSKVAKGDLPGDPCISCGENWTFIPNEPNGAVRGAERQGFFWGCSYDPDPEIAKNCRNKLHY
ncbi:uncharacterized protein METZ01_LOCUS253701 [marine metagenome]|uniref:Lipoprotein n=1 Tax=marine metagenome TaxID=408172 RepID=A0A382INR3_9ZZZZ|tara:strand:+ start:648 stop:959 length:312 start_codon:yes stop_codon:yes gene_type:complete